MTQQYGMFDGIAPVEPKAHRRLTRREVAQVSNAGVGVATTSVAAYERILPTLSARRAEVLDAITATGGRGLTIDEYSALTGKPANEFSGRFTELSAAGRIEATGALRRTRSGASAKVWRAPA